MQTVCCAILESIVLNLNRRWLHPAYNRSRGFSFFSGRFWRSDDVAEEKPIFPDGCGIVRDQSVWPTGHSGRVHQSVLVHRLDRKQYPAVKGISLHHQTNVLSFFFKHFYLILTYTTSCRLRITFIHLNYTIAYPVIRLLCSSNELVKYFFVFRK